MTLPLVDFEVKQAYDQVCSALEWYQSQDIYKVRPDDLRDHLEGMLTHSNTHVRSAVSSMYYEPRCPCCTANKEPRDCEYKDYQSTFLDPLKTAKFRIEQDAEKTFKERLKA